MIIFIVMCSFLGQVLTFVNRSDSEFSNFIGFLLSVCIPVVLFLCIKIQIKPTALDVYRGKTTLEITYRDSIPVDSVVVFK